MNHLLSVNAGSTSVKYKLFDNNLEEILFGHIENIKGKFVSKLVKNGGKYVWEITESEFKKSHLIVQKEIESYPISKIGFRIVHGGEKYTKPTTLTDKVIGELEQLNDMAPLHNPPAIKIIRQFKKIYPDIKMYGVFDTAFHSTINPEQFLYSLPYDLYQKHKIRKYGFHGISHQYIYEQVSALEKKSRKVISCHLGGGASITAIKNGESFDTSMGFTPLEGLTMATRSGDIDTGIIFYLVERKLYPIKELKNLMNHFSGLMGISGITSDMRKLLELEKKGNKRAHLAIEIYIYDIVRYIGAYIVALGGLDVLAFSGGVGSGSDVLRERICENLTAYKIKISRKNKGKINVEENLKISSRGSLPVWIIPTDEEKMIAKSII
jgi:acetate kinase